jgi:putative membrane protein
MNINSKAGRRFVGLVAAALLLALPSAKADATVASTDQDFILAAAQGGMTEVKLGELAAQNGVRADVKEFGQLMVKDHSAINANLKTLAAQKGVTLPDSLDAKHQKMVDKLTALSGSTFDKVYIASMIKDHKMDAKEFKAESAATKDTDIKSFVDKSLPVVESHLDHIKAMKK